jgi:hypothetical protein
MWMWSCRLAWVMGEKKKKKKKKKRGGTGEDAVNVPGQ